MNTLKINKRDIGYIKILKDIIEKEPGDDNTDDEDYMQNKHTANNLNRDSKNNENEIFSKNS
jgi:hypothetical protein